MRIPTLLFILYEIADVLTTVVGLQMGLGEINPIANSYGWFWVMFVKVAGVLAVCTYLQLKKPRRHDVVFPLVLAPFVMWNAFQLVLAW